MVQQKRILKQFCWNQVDSVDEFVDRAVQFALETESANRWVVGDQPLARKFGGQLLGQRARPDEIKRQLHITRVLEEAGTLSAARRRKRPFLRVGFTRVINNLLTLNLLVKVALARREAVEICTNEKTLT